MLPPSQHQLTPSLLTLQFPEPLPPCPSQQVFCTPGPSAQSFLALTPGAGGLWLRRLHYTSLSRAGPRGAALSTAETPPNPRQTSNQWEQVGGEEGSRTRGDEGGGGEEERRWGWKEGEAAQGEGGGEIEGRREGRVE